MLGCMITPTDIDYFLLIARNGDEEDALNTMEMLSQKYDDPEAAEVIFTSFWQLLQKSS